MIYYWGKVLLLKGLKCYSEESMPLLQFDEKNESLNLNSVCVLDLGSMTSAKHAIFCTNTMAMSSYIFKDKAKHNDNVLIFKQV